MFSKSINKAISSVTQMLLQMLLGGNQSHIPRSHIPSQRTVGPYNLLWDIQHGLPERVMDLAMDLVTKPLLSRVSGAQRRYATTTGKKGWRKRWSQNPP
jgi:hypothetical protein